MQLPAYPPAVAQPLRIVHIAKHCGYANGSVHVAVDLACVQAQAGHDVVFVSSGGTFVALMERHGVRHITLRQDQKKPLTLLRSAVSLWRYCRMARPSVLHAHMMGGALIGKFASLLTGVKMVTTVHNSFDRHSVLMRLGDRVVAVSNAEREHLIERGFAPRKVLAVWNAPNNSPRSDFMRNTQEFTLARPGITVICALHRRKGVFDVIDACTELFTEFADWHLTVAGEGPDRAELEAQTIERGIADRVTFLGFVPDPRPLYAQTDIFVLASYADPGSLSIGEARAAGCCIVATAVGGTTEMLDHGGAGLLVKPGDAAGLVAALRPLMRDGHRRAQMQAAARLGSEMFDVHRLLGDYDRVYRDALSG